MKNYWKNKKVLITGHTGFKGSWLSLILNYFGAEVYGVSDKPYKGIYSTLNKNIFSSEIFTDITSNNKLIENYIRANEINFIFHFAAQSLVPYAINNPVLTLNTNIIGTYNILEIAQNCKCVENLIIATTDKVYKNSDEWNTESSTLGGKEIYSISKVTAENITKYFINELSRNDLKICIIRSGNVIGGGDRGLGRLIPDLIQASVANKAFDIRNPSGIRPWQDILDSLNGYLLAAQFTDINKVSEVFNLNSKKNNFYTVKQVIEIFSKAWGEELKINIDEKNKINESSFLRLDSSKAEKMLNWIPKLSIEDSIKNIVKWEKAYLNNQSEITTLNLIKEYFDKE